MEHADYEYDAYRRIRSLIIGCHFTPKQVADLKMLLDVAQIVGELPERYKYYDSL